MLLLRADRLPDDSKWSYELKLDGYRALAIKSSGKVRLRSSNDKDFSRRYRAIVQALEALPDETVVDGEVVAKDEAGRPAFNLLQNYGSAKIQIVYYIFDLLVLNGRDFTQQPLTGRRAVLQDRVFPRLSEPVREGAPKVMSKRTPARPTCYLDWLYELHGSFHWQKAQFIISLWSSSCGRGPMACRNPLPPGRTVHPRGKSVRRIREADGRLRYRHQFAVVI